MLLTSLMALSLSCNKNKCQDGSGGRFEESRNFSNFHTFKLAIPGVIEIHHDTTLTKSRVVVFAQKNVQKALNLTNNSGVVTMEFAECFENHDEIEFKLYTPTLKKLILRSSCRVTSTKAIYSNSFEILNQGTANVDLVLKVDTFSWTGVGSTTLKLEGYSRRTNLEIKTLGTINAINLITDTCTVNLEGTGNISTYVTSYLDVKIPGGGSVTFGGEDTLAIEKNISESASLIDMRK